MVQNRLNKLNIKKIAVTFGLYIYAALCIYPFFLLFVTTFKDEKHLYNPLYIPDFANFQNYLTVLNESNFFTALFNTIIITGATLFLEILIASMAGYIISRSSEKIFKIAYMLIVCFLIIPSQTNMMVIYKLGSMINMITIS